MTFASSNSVFTIMLKIVAYGQENNEKLYDNFLFWCPLKALEKRLIKLSKNHPSDYDNVIIREIRYFFKNHQESRIRNFSS